MIRMVLIIRVVLCYKVQGQIQSSRKPWVVRELLYRPSHTRTMEYLYIKKHFLKR